jgi:two-component system response regulator AtoC
MEQTVLLAQGDVIDDADLSLPASALRVEKVFADEVGEMGLASVELELIRQALEKTGWNITRAAQVPGVSRDTLRYRVEKHQLIRKI